MLELLDAVLGFSGSTAPISILVLSFAFYGFVGWAYESTICAMLAHGHFANSGFLLGPCCPIYGVGAIACWLTLRDISSNLALFVCAAVVCCAIEYVVGWALERTTHARFWDYSKFPLNIQGRVCLYGALVFGTGAWLICRVVEPWIIRVLTPWPLPVLACAALVFTAVAIVDAMLSLASWRRLFAQLDTLRTDVADRINAGLKDASDSMVEHIPDSVLDSASAVQARGRAVNGWLVTVSDAVLESLREHVELPAFVTEGSAGLRAAARRLKDAAPSAPSLPSLRLRRRELRFFNAFPNLRMLPYEGIIRATGLAERARELFRRR